MERFFTGEIESRLSEQGDGIRLVLREETVTQWPLINLVARLGRRRFLEANHRAAMGRGEEGLPAILAGGYKPA